MKRTHSLEACQTCIRPNVKIHANKLCSPWVHHTIPFRDHFYADDSIGAKSFPREIYFSSRDARKTESKRRVSTIPPCSPRANFPEYPHRLELSFSDRESALPRSYFTIPNCGRKSRKRGRPARKMYRARTRNTRFSRVDDAPPSIPFFSPFLFFSFFFLSSLVWRVRTHTEMDNFHCSSASVKRANKLESFTWYYEGTKALFVSRPDAIADRITS